MPGERYFGHYILYFSFYFFFRILPASCILKETYMGNLCIQGAHDVFVTHKTNSEASARAFILYTGRRMMKDGVCIPEPKLEKRRFGPRRKWTIFWKKKCKRYLGPLFRRFYTRYLFGSNFTSFLTCTKMASRRTVIWSQTGSKSALCVFLLFF